MPGPRPNVWLKLRVEYARLRWHGKLAVFVWLVLALVATGGAVTAVMVHLAKWLTGA